MQILCPSLNLKLKIFNDVRKIRENKCFLSIFGIIDMDNR